MPLGRLTYCVYLIHLDYLNVFYAHNRKLLYYTFIDALTTYFGIAVTVFGLAFVVTVTIEASFLNLEKFIFSSGISILLQLNALKDVAMSFFINSYRIPPSNRIAAYFGLGERK